MTELCLRTVESPYTAIELWLPGLRLVGLEFFEEGGPIGKMAANHMDDIAFLLQDALA